MIERAVDLFMKTADRMTLLPRFRAHRAPASSILCAFCFLLALASVNGGVAEAGKRVLVIHSFGSAAPPFTTYSVAFETELTQRLGEPVDLDEVSLDHARFAEHEAEEALVDYLQKRQAKWQPDLVVPIGSPAGVFVEKYRERLFPQTPILYSAMDTRRPPGEFQKNAAFVGESFNAPSFIEDILQVAPDTTNIVCVIGASPLERFWTATFQTEFARFTNRVSFTWLNDLPFDKMLNHLHRLPPHSFIFLILLIRDAAGITHNADDSLSRILEVANAPVNSPFEHQLGLGIVGGRLYRDAFGGAESARIAMQILQGEPASNIAPVNINPTGPEYDWRQLHRWSIREDRLPPGRVVKYRVPTTWERYQLFIIAGLAALCLQALLIAALVINLNRRQKAERFLRESEERVKLAAEAAQLGIWEWDFASNKIWGDERSLERIGPGNENDTGHSRFLRTVYPEDCDGLTQAVARAINGDGNLDHVYRRVLSGGRVTWIASRGRVEFDAEHRPMKMRGVSMDVTARKVAEQQARESEEARKKAETEAHRWRQELARVSRVSIMGELAASMAHELNQPLTAILANAGAAQRFLTAGQADPGELGEIVKDIAHDTIRAGDVIRRVRALVKKEDQHLTNLKVDEAIREVVSFLHGDIVARNGRVELELAPDLPSVRGDPIQFQQVLVNLVLNAFDAMDRLEFQKRCVILSARREPSGSVRVTVRDSGTGIPEDKLKLIFEPFYTTKANGMGMGLSVTQTIVESHGGRIWAENNEGGGAVFHITLPAANGEA